MWPAISNSLNGPRKLNFPFLLTRPTCPSSIASYPWVPCHLIQSYRQRISPLLFYYGHFMGLEPYVWFKHFVYDCHHNSLVKLSCSRLHRLFWRMLRPDDSAFIIGYIFIRFLFTSLPFRASLLLLIISFNRSSNSSSCSCCILCFV